MAAGLMVASLTVAGFLYWSDIKVNLDIFKNDPASSQTPGAASAKTVVASAEPSATSPQETSPVVAPLEAAVRTSKAMTYAVTFPSVLAKTITDHQDWVQSVAF
jgi:hypothetical protein